MKIGNRPVGKDLADRHNSILQRNTIEDMYEGVSSAARHKLLETNVQKGSKRMDAIADGLDRIDRLGKYRKTEHYISPRDQIFIDKEFQFLSQRLYFLANEASFDNSVQVLKEGRPDPKNPQSTEAAMNQFKRIVKAIYAGELSASDIISSSCFLIWERLESPTVNPSIMVICLSRRLFARGETAWATSVSS